MILSVSRRTDIPNYYSEWFFNRIKEGFVCVRNPMNPQQVSRIDVTPKVVDCIVFWTKNPEPMLNRLDELASYDYYFQFTLTGYGKDIECNVPHKKERMIPIFQELSKRIGAKKVIWRYDPIIFTKKYTPEYHLKAFEQIAKALNGYTKKCIISFVDIYAKNKKSMEALGVYELSPNELLAFAKKLAVIAKENGMTVGSCAENMDLAECGIEHNCCIDKALIEEITGCKLKVGKDKNQRAECGCVESIEIGTYDTCKNGCKYCYANHSEDSVVKNCNKYNPESPILCGILNENDKITDRQVKSLKEQELITKVFGEKLENEIYHDRVAAYIVLIDDDKVAVVKTASGKLFLPGGKIEAGESKEECVVRECLEEMGAKVTVKQYFAIGARYFYHEASKSYSHAIGHFFFSDEYEKVCEPIEEDESVLWLPYEDVIEGIYHPHHRWAVEYIWNNR